MSRESGNLFVFIPRREHEEEYLFKKTKTVVIKGDKGRTRELILKEEKKLKWCKRCGLGVDPNFWSSHVAGIAHKKQNIV